MVDEPLERVLEREKRHITKEAKAKTKQVEGKVWESDAEAKPVR